MIMGTCLSGTTTINYNDTTPPDRKCILLIPASLTVTSFDNKAVNWTTDSGWASVKIPEGNHVFTLNYMGTDKNPPYKQENIRYEFAGFVAGKTYKMYTEEAISQNSRILHIKMKLEP